MVNQETRGAARCYRRRASVPCGRLCGPRDDRQARLHGDRLHDPPTTITCTTDHLERDLGGEGALPPDTATAARPEGSGAVSLAEPSSIPTVVAGLGHKGQPARALTDQGSRRRVAAAA